MQCIIVLGNRNPKITNARVKRAIQEFTRSPYQYADEKTGHLSPTKLLLFSGGSNDGKSEPTGAAMMYECALALGVDPKFIITETKSRNTIENLFLSKHIVDKLCEGYSIKPLITICTSSFHIKRAALLSGLILYDYPLQFIHTNEKIPAELQAKERTLTIDNVCFLHDTLDFGVK